MDVHGLAVNVLPSATNTQGFASQTPDSAPAAGTGRVLLIPFAVAVSLILCLYWYNLIQLIAIMNQQHIKVLAIKVYYAAPNVIPLKMSYVVPASFPRFHLCNTLTRRFCRALMSMCCSKHLQSRHSFALPALLGQEWFVPHVLSTEQYQTPWLEVIDIPRARLMKTL